MDESGAYYTEWNKSEREGHILYVNACMWNLEDSTDNPQRRQWHPTPVLLPRKSQDQMKEWFTLDWKMLRVGHPSIP